MRAVIRGNRIQSIMGKVCKQNLPVKLLCVLGILPLQAFILDSLLITYYHGFGIADGYNDSSSAMQTHPRCNACSAWIAGDVAIIMLFIVSFAISVKKIQRQFIFELQLGDHIARSLRLSIVTWFVYSCYVAIRVTVIFSANINNIIEPDFVIGPQFLKTGIALTAVVFILFVASHHRAEENVLQKYYINSMASGVTFDILDTVEFLDVLFVEETELILPYALQNAILAIAFINLIRPTFSFLVLFLKHLKSNVLPREVSAANALIYIFLVNLPFLLIRMILWHNLSQDVSVFLVKNFIMIFLGIYELYEIGQDRAKTETPPEELEMHPRHTGKRPSTASNGDNSAELQL